MTTSHPQLAAEKSRPIVNLAVMTLTLVVLWALVIGTALAAYHALT
jgi:hypothetical protein